jgi:2-oxoglutarate ferredoxin oxidoreductase subunit alpha
MTTKTFVGMFAGEAGYGGMSAGAIAAKAASRNGLWAFVANEYPSLIKGGLNTCLVRLSTAPLTAYSEELDFLATLSPAGLAQNYGKLKPGAILVYDAAAVKPDPALLPTSVRAIPLDLTQGLTGDDAKVMGGSAMLGAFCALTGFPAQPVTDVMAGEFKGDVLTKNQTIFAEARRAAAQAAAGAAFPLALVADGQPKMLLTGNDALCIGAIRAGCRFVAGYPMTPSSGILTYMADHAADYSLVFKQSEDEIAAINMLIGAGFAGVRALGATSGGGFSLMTEALGFAGQAEVPIVIVLGQRGGPSTGLPTRTAQGDLAFAVHASQGEFPRLIVAPGDVGECFSETFRVFNLAEKYQLPAIILTDKFLADASVSHPYFDDSGLAVARGKLADESWLAGHQPYWRYRSEADGVSWRAIPGQKGGRHIATSYTHGEDGFYSSGNREYAGDEPAVTAAGLDKLFRKVPALLAEIPATELHGPATADLTLISWGSTKGAILEALEMAAGQGLAVNFLQVRYLSPFPAAAVADIFAKARRTLLLEGNKTAQLGALIGANTGYRPENLYLKYDSRPFTPAAIVARIKEVLA